MKDRLARVAKIVKMSETDLAEACVEALIDYIEQHGEITMPLSVLPESAVRRLKEFEQSRDVFVTPPVTGPAKQDEDRRKKSA